MPCRGHPFYLSEPTRSAGYPELKSQSVFSSLHWVVSSSHISRDSAYIIPWLASPLDENSVLSPRLRQRADAGPIELFYDVFLVANLATFSATHEITDIKGW